MYRNSHLVTRRGYPLSRLAVRPPSSIPTYKLHPLSAFYFPTMFTPSRISSRTVKFSGHIACTRPFCSLRSSFLAQNPGRLILLPGPRFISTMAAKKEFLVIIPDKEGMLDRRMEIRPYDECFFSWLDVVVCAYVL